MKYFVDTWSRIDLPTVSQLRSVADGKVIQEIERADIQELVKAGWRAPEVFTSMGRDGKTDIWGIIIRPGQGHSAGGEYGERKRFDFFVHHLVGMEPPDWNAVEAAKVSGATSSMN
jgi:hypothetical protein